jgi:WD40 repeat protein
LEGIATAASNFNIRIWLLFKKSILNRFIGHISGVSCLLFTKKNEFLVSGSKDKSIRIWSLETNLCIFKLIENRQILSISYYCATTGDFQRLASSSQDFTIKIWDMNNLIAPKCTIGNMNNMNSNTDMPAAIELKGHTNFVHYVEYSHDGKKILSASRDSKIKIWSLENEVCLLITSTLLFRLVSLLTIKKL